MGMIRRKRLAFEALRVAVVLLTVCAASSAFAASDTCVYNFDASGNETLTSEVGGRQSVSCNPSDFFSSTYYSALNFTPATTITNQSNANTTELIGTLNGGATILDLNFNVAFNTPSVQAGILSVENAIMAAGGPGVVITNPVLTSNAVSNSSTSMSTYTVSGINTTSALTTTVGPGVVDLVINVGTGTYPPVDTTGVTVGYDASGNPVPVTITTLFTNANQAPMLPNVYTVCSPTLSTVTDGAISNVPVGTVLTTMPTCSPNNGGTYTLQGGQANYNVAQTTTFTIDTATTTTNTTTTTAVYDINGVSANTIPPVPPTPPVGIPVPEPRSITILALGLVALIGRARAASLGRRSLRVAVVLGTLCAPTMMIAHSTASAATYSAVGDFSNTNGPPNGVWSYYTAEGPFSAGNVYNTPSYFGFANFTAPPFSAAIVKNATSAPVTVTGANNDPEVIPTDHLFLSGEGLALTVAFTAPTAGTYAITGDFLGVDQGEQSHRVVVQLAPAGSGTLLNANSPLFDPLYSSTIDTYGQSDPFSLTATLAAGDQIGFDTFEVPGSINLATGLAATITLAGSTAPPTPPPSLPPTPTTVPEPLSLALLGVGAMASIGAGRVWRINRAPTL